MWYIYRYIDIDTDVNRFGCFKKFGGPSRGDLGNSKGDGGLIYSRFRVDPYKQHMAVSRNGVSFSQVSVYEGSCYFAVHFGPSCLVIPILRIASWSPILPPAIQHLPKTTPNKL